MKLYSLSVYHKLDSGAGASSEDVRLLKSASDLASFSFYQRGSVEDFMKFTGKLIIERSGLASRSSVKEQGYLCHAYIRADGLAGLLISDDEYPARVAQSLLSRALDEFTTAIPQSTWPTATPQSCVQFKQLDALLSKYQNPNQADAMSRVQSEVDETKIVLHDTIAAVLDRGEKLDTLVERSDDLSNQSKMFYKQAKKMNKCCDWV